jgi:chorismate-pyruvate lyase
MERTARRRQLPFLGVERRELFRRGWGPVGVAVGAEELETRMEPATASRDHTFLEPQEAQPLDIVGRRQRISLHSSTLAGATPNAPDTNRARVSTSPA